MSKETPSIDSTTVLHVACSPQGNNLPNYPSTEGIIYDRETIPPLANDQSIPRHLRIIGGTVQDGIFEEVLFAQERRAPQSIIGREAIRGAMSDEQTFNGGSSDMDGMPAGILAVYQALRRRVTEELNRLGKASVPKDLFGRTLIAQDRLVFEPDITGKDVFNLSVSLKNMGDDSASIEVPTGTIPCVDMTEQILEIRQSLGVLDEQ